MAGTLVPKDIRYAKSHEWARVEGELVVIGITDHAQHALNDIVFVELPSVGDSFEAKQEFGTVESVKSVSDLYLPVAGEVVEINEALEDQPELVNDSPYKNGWLIKIRPVDVAHVSKLLDAAAYQATIE